MGIPVWERRAAWCADSDNQPPPDDAEPGLEALAPDGDATATGPRAFVDESTPLEKAPVADPAEAWERLRTSVAGCVRCGLCEGRTQTVFGVGSQTARLMIVGEAPGAEEDRRGEPFVGRAGKLLDRMLAAIGLDRQHVFIANTLKCRPPGNRDPHADEVAACMPYLLEQLRLLQPRVILCVGRVAAHNLLQVERPLRELRTGEYTLQVQCSSIPVIVSYHPAYLLRNPADKGKAWQDLKRVRALLRESMT